MRETYQALVLNFKFHCKIKSLTLPFCKVQDDDIEIAKMVNNLVKKSNIGIADFQNYPEILKKLQFCLTQSVNMGH